MNLRKDINTILIILILAVGAFFAYKFYTDQETLRQQVADFCGVVPAEDGKVERVVETVVRKTNPWGALQPKIKDSVVQIFSHHAEFNWLQPYQTPVQKASAGSGFFIDDKGHIITNAHVVTQSKALVIQLPSLGKEQFEVEIVGICFDRDIALLKLKDVDLGRIKSLLGRINYLQLGDSDKILRAEEIMLMGYPLGQQGLKSTVGVVSGREDMQGRQYIQIDAAANPGNSGGPAFSINGDVIGILNSGITGAQNVGYIIPIKELKVVLSDLYSTPSKLIRRPFLGVFYNSASNDLASYLGNPTPGGVYVTDIYKNSVLDVAGVLPGDMLYEMNGYKIDLYGEISVPWSEDKISLSEYISFLEIGAKIKLVAYRKGKLKLFNFEFKQSKLPAIRFMYPDYEKIDYEVIGGFVVMQLTLNHVAIMSGAVDDVVKYKSPKNQDKSVLVVTHIFPASQAQKSRVFEAGNLLKKVNGENVGTLAELRKALYKSEKSGDLTVTTNNNVFAVFPFKKVLQDEQQLSLIYHYPISKTVQDIYNKVFDSKKQNALDGSKLLQKAAL